MYIYIYVHMYVHMHMHISADQYDIGHHSSLLAVMTAWFTWAPAAEKDLDHEGGTCRSHMAIQAVLGHLYSKAVFFFSSHGFPDESTGGHFRKHQDDIPQPAQWSSTHQSSAQPWTRTCQRGFSTAFHWNFNGRCSICMAVGRDAERLTSNSWKCALIASCKWL